MKELDLYRDTAIEAAKKAGRVLMKHFNAISDFQIKKEAGIVTKADMESEDLLSSIFNKKTPNFGILGEETGLKGSDETKWIIDPLDGTTNFFHGFPHFNISIALEHKGTINVAVIHNPVTGDMYHAIKGKGSYKNDKKIKVSSTNELTNAMIGTGFAYMRGEPLEDAINLFRKFTYKSQGIRRPGAAALDLCYLAEGIYDGFYEKTLAPWDMAAGSLLIEEAGGKVSNCKGQKFSIYGKDVVASNSILHEKILEVINSD